MAVHATQHIDPFEDQVLEGLCRAVADTERGLTGSEIGHLLADCRVKDTDPSLTKWKRLFNALGQFQNEHRTGIHVVRFLTKAMHPARYTSSPEKFAERQSTLNPILALVGLEIRDDGRMRKVSPASNLNEARARSNRLKQALLHRGVHPDVLKYCEAEIVVDNTFHAVFEAMKSITAKLRLLTGLTSDGAELVEQAFGFSNTTSPILAISELNTQTLQGEQRGFISLLRGLYGTMRNPLAHNAKIEWDMTEQDALDILTMISLVHRKLDRTTRIKQS
jgi:uncharacterized protein (TIGR02391 family)